MEGSVERLKSLLTSVGYPPTKEISESSINEDFFELVITFKNKPDKYGMFAIGGRAIALNLAKTREEIIQMLEEVILLASPDTEPQ